MLKENRFLLISDSHNGLWYQVFEEATASLGTLQMASEEEALRLARQQDYDIIVIDAAQVVDAFLLVSSIRMRKPNAKIVVATASPTWRRAREAFRAGATDYIRKSMNQQEILSALRATMGKVSPPWRR